MKLLFPDPEMPVSDEDLEWIVRLALESRRRVKEQQKRVFKSEFRNTHFSYIMGPKGWSSSSRLPSYTATKRLKAIHCRQGRFGAPAWARRKRVRAYTE